MSDIEQRIIQAQDNYWQRTGEPPSAIYLGRSEYMEFKAFCDYACVVRIEDVTGRPHRTYRGVQVLEVNTPSHIGAGV